MVGLGLTVVGLWFDRGLFLFDTGFGAVCVEGMKTFRVSSLLFCSGAAQVCHVLRVVGLREQLEVEEEDGDRQEEEEEVESGEASQGECAMWMTMDECESAQNLSQRM